MGNIEMDSSKYVANSGDFRATIKRNEEPRWLTWVRDFRFLVMALVLATLLLLIGYMLWPKAEVAQASTIEAQAGDSLIKIYGFDDGINVAERLSLPLRKREMGDGRLVPISYADARALKTATDRNLITGKLYPGDRVTTMRFKDGHVDLKTGFVYFSPGPNSPALADR
jgi:hypothetical protein